MILNDSIIEDKMKILVTGHKGFIGSYIANYPNPRLLVEGFEWVENVVPNVEGYDWVILIVVQITRYYRKKC